MIYVVAPTAKHVDDWACNRNLDRRAVFHLDSVEKFRGIDRHMVVLMIPPFQQSPQAPELLKEGAYRHVLFLPAPA